MKISRDKFQNFIIENADSYEVVNQFINQSYVEEADHEHAFIFVNCAKIAQKIGAKLQTKKGAQPEIWVLRANSNCPLLYEGIIESSQIRLFVIHYGIKYMIQMHDKSKNFATACGGTAELDEYSLSKDLIRAKTIAEREVKEETTGLFESKFFNGLCNLNMSPFLKLYFTSTYFGITKVPDTCWQFVAECNDKILINALFSQTKDKNGVYVLHYHNHKETNWLCAIPVSILQQHFETRQELFVKGVRITFLQMALDLISIDLVKLDIISTLQYEKKTPPTFVNAEKWPIKKAKSNYIPVFATALGIASFICYYYPSARIPFAALVGGGTVAVGGMFLFWTGLAVCFDVLLRRFFNGQ